MESTPYKLLFESFVALIDNQNPITLVISGIATQVSTETTNVPVKNIEYALEQLSTSDDIHSAVTITVGYKTNRISIAIFHCDTEIEFLPPVLASQPSKP
ncbi:hypothetical protein GCM10027180_33200 [Microbulbifer echini]